MEENGYRFEDGGENHFHTILRLRERLHELPPVPEKTAVEIRSAKENEAGGALVVVEHGGGLLRRKRRHARALGVRRDIDLSDEVIEWLHGLFSSGDLWQEIERRNRAQRS